MLEAVGQGETLFSDGFPHQKQLILSSIDALVEDRIVRFVFVKQFQFGPGDPNQRVEPMCRCAETVQQKVQGMPVADMHLFVQEDGRVLGGILAAHYDGPAPAEGGLVLFRQD